MPQPPDGKIRIRIIADGKDAEVPPHNLAKAELDEKTLQELRELAALKAMTENNLLCDAANGVLGKIDAAMEAVEGRKMNTADWEEKRRRRRTQLRRSVEEAEEVLTDQEVAQEKQEKRENAEG